MDLPIGLRLSLLNEMDDIVVAEDCNGSGGAGAFDPVVCGLLFASKNQTGKKLKIKIKNLN